MSYHEFERMYFTSQLYDNTATTYYSCANAGECYLQQFVQRNGNSYRKRRNSRLYLHMEHCSCSIYANSNRIVRGNIYRYRERRKRMHHYAAVYHHSADSINSNSIAGKSYLL